MRYETWLCYVRQRRKCTDKKEEGTEEGPLTEMGIFLNARVARSHDCNEEVQEDNVDGGHHAREVNGVEGAIRNARRGVSIHGVPFSIAEHRQAYH